MPILHEPLSPRTLDAAPAASVLIDVGQLARLLGVSTRTLWRHVSAGKAPQPVRLGGCTRWRRDDIDRWVADGCPAIRPPAASSHRKA